MTSKDRDIGNSTMTKDGQDAVHHIPFTFTFLAFNAEGKTHMEKSDAK